MTVVLRRADLHRDKQQIIAVLQRNLPSLPHDRRFDWLYLNNPAGQAWCWIARETASQRPVGVASLFPRSMWCVANPAARCGQVGDFAIDANFRSLGPAVMLQRATFEPVDEGQLVFCYDCPPHDQGMAPFRRLDISANRRVARYARLQRSRRELEKLMGANVLSRLLSRLTDAFLTKRRLHRTSPGITVALHAGGFDEEFTRLDERVGHQLGMRSRRGARELNWRYMGDPINSYRVVTARRRGELAGYAVFATRGEDAFVIDLLTVDLDGAGLTLLDLISETVKADNTQALYVLVAEGSRLYGLLDQGRGFQFRSHAANVVVYEKPSLSNPGVARKDGDWFFTHADLLA